MLLWRRLLTDGYDNARGRGGIGDVGGADGDLKEIADVWGIRRNRWLS